MNRLIIAAMIALAGCAATEFTGTCALAPVGMTDGGITVARVHCKASP